MSDDVNFTPHVSVSAESVIESTREEVAALVLVPPQERHWTAGPAFILATAMLGFSAAIGGWVAIQALIEIASR